MIHSVERNKDGFGKDFGIAALNMDIHMKGDWMEMADQQVDWYGMQQVDQKIHHIF